MRVLKLTTSLLPISLPNSPPKLWPGWITFPAYALKWRLVQCVTLLGMASLNLNLGRKTSRWFSLFHPGTINICEIHFIGKFFNQGKIKIILLGIISIVCFSKMSTNIDTHELHDDEWRRLLLSRKKNVWFTRRSLKTARPWPVDGGLAFRVVLFSNIIFQA